jgi:hypothetical protein
MAYHQSSPPLQDTNSLTPPGKVRQPPFSNGNGGTPLKGLWRDVSSDGSPRSAGNGSSQTLAPAQEARRPSRLESFTSALPAEAVATSPMPHTAARGFHNGGGSALPPASPTENGKRSWR